MNIKSFPKDQRPREKLLKHGPTSLSNSELLAIILRTGTQKENVLNLAHKLFDKYSLKKLSRANPSKLKKSLGIGDAKACQVLACFELGRRLASFNEEEKPLIRHARDVVNKYTPELSSLKQEHFKALYLNTRKRLISESTLFIGTLNESVVHPREIFHHALEENAAAIILLHNHPSGDPTPSNSDTTLTTEIINAGTLLGIPVLDHIIIGDNNYFSFREQEKL